MGHERRTRGRCVTMLLIASMLLFVGCPRPPMRPPPLPPTTELRPLPPGATVTAIELQPLAPATETFVITRGRNEGAVRAATFEKVGEGQWRSTVEGERVAHLMIGPDGSLNIVREEEMDENVEVTYEPPLPMLPGQLVAGQPVQGQVRMIVRNVSNGSVRDQGTCTYSIELVGRQRVETPAGVQEAYFVRSVRNLNLNLAKVSVTIDTAYAPGKGQVVERIEQRLQALGLFGATTIQEMRRGATPPQVTPSGAR